MVPRGDSFHGRSAPARPEASVLPGTGDHSPWRQADYPVVPIPLAPLSPLAGVGVAHPAQSHITAEQITLTANAGQVVRSVAKTSLRKYAEVYMGQKQHPIHVLRDMRRHPERADRVIGETVFEFFAGVLFRIGRDLLEDLTPVAHTLLTIQEVFGKGRAFVARGEDGKLHINFRRLRKVEKVLFFIAALIPIFPINTIYDLCIGLFALVWGTIKTIYRIITTPYALIRGPKNYDMKTGQVKNLPNAA